MASQDPDQSKREQSTTEEKKERAEQSNVGQATLRIDVSFSDPVIHKLIAREETASRQEQERDLRDQTRLKWEKRAVIVVLAYTTVAFFQLIFYRLNSMRQLRAYINPIDVQLQCPDCDIPNYKGPEVIAGLTIKDAVRITFQNGGQTPAYNLMGHANWVELPFGCRLPKGFTYPDVETANNAKTEVLLTSVPVNPAKNYTIPFVVNVNLIQRGRDRKVTLFLYGHADYQDIFHKSRHTPFCYMYLPDAPKPEAPFGAFAACPEHNDPD